MIPLRSPWWCKPVASVLAVVAASVVAGLMAGDLYRGLRRRLLGRALLAGCLFLAPGALLAQSPAGALSQSSSQESAAGEPASEDPEAESEEAEPSPVVAAGWCVLRSSRPEPEPTVAEDGEEEPAAAEDNPKDLGCDVGVALGLIRRGRLSWVAGIGTGSVVTGLAWRPNLGRGPVLAVALGVALPYDSQGIYSGEAALALGATLSFSRAGQ